MNSDPFLACWSPLLVNLLKPQAFKPRQKQIGLRSLGSYLSERPTVSGVVNGWVVVLRKMQNNWCDDVFHSYFFTQNTLGMGREKMRSVSPVWLAHVLSQLGGEEPSTWKISILHLTSCTICNQRLLRLKTSLDKKSSLQFLLPDSYASELANPGGWYIQ